MAQGCKTPTDDCADVGRDGLLLVVTDSATGASLANLATVTVTQLTAPFESRTGSLTASPSPLDVAADRPGPYQITIMVSGYHAWQKEVSVAQSEGRCPQTVTLTVDAKLVPAG
jgi:hypothetical protein